MALEKRGKIWHIVFTPPGGRRIRVSARTENKAQAEELENALKNKYWRASKLGEKPPFSWTQAVVKWLKEKERDKKKSLDEDKRILRWLDTYLRPYNVHEIDNEVIDHIIEKRIEAGNLQKPKEKKEEEKKVKPVSNATINRMLEIIRAILRKCANEWTVLDRCPSIKMMKENNERIRWITPKEAARLLRELPEHSAATTRFGLRTGLRESNVTQLKWNQINLEKGHLWKSNAEMKNGDSLGIPLSPQAIRILKKQLGKHPIYVFTYEGQPINRAHTAAWNKAVARAEIEDFHWHDLRHTWASWHIQKGTPLHVLKELGGWKTLSMVMRYAHLNTEHLAQYVNKKIATKLTQNSG